MNVGFTVKNLCAVQYVPRMARFHNKGRATSAFLYILDGSYIYRTAEGKKEAARGDAVYLPVFSEYSYEILGGKAECIYVEFLLEAEEGGEVRIEPLCSAPQILHRSGDGRTLHSLFHELLSAAVTDRFAALANLYRLICLLERERSERESGSLHLGKIAPAVRYIQSHYQCPIAAAELSALCGISEGHMRRLFLQKLGLSPVRYKNALAAEAACTLLRMDGMSVGEVAAALGYPDIYTFSQAFKKEIGVSPKKYAQGL